MLENPCDRMLALSGDRRREYSRRVAAGLEVMREFRVVICALTRDAARQLPHTIHWIEQLGSLFRDYRAVIYENDSADATTETLQMWQRQNERVTVLTEKLGDPVNPPTRCPARADRMARYRNRYRQFVAHAYSDFDYAIVVDSDLEGGWSFRGVANTFGHHGWDAVGSYGILSKQYLLHKKRIHFDAWAFRVNGSLEPLPTKKVNRLSWQPGDPMVQVASSFGGLGVYRMPALIHCAYRGGDCEHVGLHEQMIKIGMHRLFLNPSQLTFYGVKRSRARRVVGNALQGISSRLLQQTRRHPTHGWANWHAACGSSPAHARYHVCGPEVKKNARAELAML